MYKSERKYCESGRDALMHWIALFMKHVLPRLYSPHSPLLFEAVVPSVERIVHSIQSIASI